MHETLSEPETEFGAWSTRVTLDIIGIAGFGQDFNSLKNPDDEFAEQYNELLEPTTEKAAFFALTLVFPDWLIRSIPFWKIPRNLNRISANLKTFAYNLAKDRRAELDSPKMTASEKESRHDILSLLVKSNDFTDLELSHQVLTMMAAGHETTSSTLAWCAYLLAKHPKIQTEVRQEVRDNLPSPDNHPSETITATTIDAMPLLNAVCNEVTRLYPTVPVTTRIVSRQTQLCGHVLPEGTNIYICPWATNRSKQFWGEDASEFKPERWINKDGSSNNTGGATSNYSNTTFLHGPRSCIGQGSVNISIPSLFLLIYIEPCFGFQD